MTTSVLPVRHERHIFNQQNKHTQTPYCNLLWRRGQLLVIPGGALKQPYLCILDRKESLVECLQHSPVNLVRIDPRLGEVKVRLWADVCEQAHKPIYLRIPSNNNIHKSRGISLLRWIKRLTERLTALILMLIFSPLILGIIFWIQPHAPQSLFSHEWHVGERGKLFRKFKLCITTAHNKNAEYQSNKIMLLANWITKYGLEKLPQLFNVCRGEMGLFGPQCWCLQEAVRLSPEKKRQLNQLPGIIRLQQFQGQSEIISLDGLNVTKILPHK